MDIYEAPLNEKLKETCRRRRAEGRIKLFTQLPDILMEEAESQDYSKWTIGMLKQWACDLDDVEEFCKQYELSYTRTPGAVMIWFDPIIESDSITP